MSEIIPNLPDDYARLLAEVKERVRAAQHTALKAVNKELVGLYWDIGRLSWSVSKFKAGASRWCSSLPLISKGNSGGQEAFLHPTSGE